MFCPESALRQNNFNAVRLILAIMVIFSHSYPLSQGNNHHEPFYRLTRGFSTGGGLAVEAFFIISGFLITGSWLRNEKIVPFIKSRILRIYPGYIVSLFISILLAAACSRHSFGYCSALSLKRLVENGILLGYGALDNIFAFSANVFPGVVNGSLWTIRYEFMCYLTIALLGTAGLLRSRAFICSIFAAIFGLFCFRNLNHTDRIFSYWHFLPVFLSGALFFTLRRWIPKSGALGALAIVLLVAGFLKPPLLNLVLPIAGTYLLLLLCLLPPLEKLSFFRRNDLSYGTYLYGFPVMQCVQRFLHIKSPPVLFIISLAGAIFIAFLSWIIIEKPCLRLKKRNLLSLFMPRTDRLRKPAEA